MTYFVKRVQRLLNLLGANPRLYEDGVPGPKTVKAVEEQIAKLQGPVAPTTGAPAHMTEARKHLGKRETDSVFAALMVGNWKRVGLSLKTIATSWAAWCGLFIATALGVTYQGGGLARNWGKFGTEIAWQTQGIPEGAIVWINHTGDCKSSSSNHVTFANGDCSVSEVGRPGATFGGLGGNQSNSVNVATYCMKGDCGRKQRICAVRWPDGITAPKLPVTVSRNCTPGGATQDVTR
jgi:hypothetical protein